jgi:hypothetical protein
LGYQTDYKGKLLFTRELMAKELAFLNTMLGEDVREHREWGDLSKYDENGLYYLEFKLTKELDGIEWDGAEKFDSAVGSVNFLIDRMKTIAPDFGFKGTINAQGEDVDDRWRLAIENGKAIRVDVKPKGKKIKCPNCGESFYYDCEKGK